MQAKKYLLGFFAVLFIVSMIFCSISFRAMADDTFKITSTNGTEGTVAASAAMFSDDANYTFTTPPANIVGAKYVKTTKAGDTYTAVNSGWVYVLTTLIDANGFSTVTQKEYLLNNGFEEINFTFAHAFCSAHQASPANASSFAPFRIYKKYVKDGATFTLSWTSVVIYNQTELVFDTVGIPLNAGDTLSTVKVGETIWSNSTETFSESLPDVFKGLPYMKSVKTTAKSKVIQSGYVYTLAPNTSLTGWSKINIDPIHVYDDTTNYYVHYKTVDAGGNDLATGGSMIQIFSKNLLPLTDSQKVVSMDKMALVEVSDNVTVRPFKNGERIVCDRNFTITGAQDNLTEFYHTFSYMDANQSGKATSVKVTKDGKLYAIANGGGSAQFTNQGFTKVNDIPIWRLWVNGESTYLFQKDVKAGETYTLNAKWGTFLISNAPSTGESTATLSGTHASGFAMRKVKIEDGARIYDNRHFFVADDIPAWLYGKSILQPKFDEGATITVEKAGVVYMLVNQGVSAPNGFVKLNFPTFEFSYSMVMRNAQLYAKTCTAGEKITYSATCVPVFGALEDSEYDIENAKIPANITNLATKTEAERAEYDVQKREYQGCATIAVTQGGRYFYGMFTGGKGEDPENYSIVMVGDDQKLDYDPLLVVKHSALAPDRVRIEDIQLWMQPGTNRLWVFWTASGCIEEWNDTWSHFDHSLGVWVSIIENPDVADLKDLEWTAPKRVCDGLMRNKPTVLSNGDILICSYDAMNNSWANVYEMKKDNVDVWIQDANASEWAEKGSVYAPQNSVFDEHQIVELSNGTLWMLMRSNLGITQSYSYDGGVHWSQATLVPHLKGGDSRFYLAKLPAELAEGLSGDILFVNHMPPSGISRTWLSAMILNEKGEIVHGPLVLDERAVSYPDVEILPDGTILTVYDRGRTSDLEMLLAKYTVEDIVSGTFSSEGSQSKILLSKSYAKTPATISNHVFAVVGQNAIIKATLPSREFKGIARYQGGDFAEEVSSDYYTYENNVLTLSGDYLKTLDGSEYDFVITATRYDGSEETFPVKVVTGTTSTGEVSFKMTEEEKSKMKFVTSGNESDVFSFTSDSGRDVLKIHNSTTSWAHDSVLADGHYFGDVVLETTFRRDASVGNKTGFPVIVMRKTAPENTHEQPGGGIGFAFLKEGVLVVYDLETSSYIVNTQLEEGLYKDDEYNTVKIVTEGNQFMIYLNGKYVMNYAHTKGLLAVCGYAGIASSNGVIYVDSFKVSQFDENTLTVSDASRFYDFSDASQMDDFESWYTNDNQSATLEAFNNRWSIDTNARRVYRKAQTSDGPSSNITTLYLKDVFLSNFDMSVDFKRNTANFNWVTLVGRAREKGFTPESAYSGGGGGFTAFLQREGYPTFRSATSGGYLTGTTLVGYVDTNWHNLRVVCVGMEYRIYVDYQLVFTHVGNDHDALGGFLGMQSRNNTGAYSNFSVTALDAFGNPIALGSASNKIKVATIGDSITYGAGALNGAGKLDPMLTYPVQLAQLLGSEFDLRNFGIAGRHMIDGLVCFAEEPEYQASLDFAPDVVFIMLGTNDIKGDVWTGDDAAERYVAHYETMISDYRRINPAVEIFVMTSPYLYMEHPNLSGERLKEIIIPLQRQIAEDNNCHLIDIFTVTTGKPELFPDTIHPNAEGYKLLADTVYEAMLSDLGATINKTEELAEELLIEENDNVKVSLNLNDINLAGAKVYYRSENEQVATVDENGNVVAISEGQTQIIAYVGDISITFNVIVKKHVPEVNVSIPNEIYVYGDKMPAITTDSTLGRVSFVEGQTLSAGEKEYSWTFIPFNESYYARVNGSIIILVEKATPTVVAPVVEKSVYSGTTLKLSELTLTNGFTWNTPDTEVSESGFFKATFVSEDSENYKSVIVDVYVNLTIIPVTAQPVDAIQKSVYQGNEVKLSDLTLPANYAWKSADTVVEQSGYFDAVYTHTESGQTVDVKVYVDLNVIAINASGCTSTSAVRGFTLPALLIACAFVVLSVRKKNNV